MAELLLMQSSGSKVTTSSLVSGKMAWFGDLFRGPALISARLSSLTLTASLKAAELSAILLLYQSQVQSISTRILVQSALTAWDNGNHTQEAVAGVTVCTRGSHCNSEGLRNFSDY